MLCNAVRVNHQGGRLWVTEPAAIAAHGRHEETVTVSEVLSDEDAERVGRTVMAERTEPALSIDASVLPIDPQPHRDYDLGDRFEVLGETQRVVGYRRSLDEVGDWGPATPQWSSLRDERRRTADRALQRLMSMGSVVSAQARPSQADLELGEVRKLDTLKWSFYDPAPSGEREVLDDDSQWATEVIREVCRAGGITATVDYEGATGWSWFQILRNGVLWNGLWDVVYSASQPPGFPAWIFVPQYGYSFLYPGDEISIRCIQNGQHRQGSISMDLVPGT